MRYLFVFVFIISSNLLFARKGPEVGGLPGLIIESSELDKSIPKGQVIIEGNIKMFSSALGLENVEVGTNSSKTLTDSSGNFSLNTAASDTLFYCYLKGWSEIYEVNPEFIRNRHRIRIQAYMVMERNQVLRKPVIYLYNNEETIVDLSVKPKGEFSFTYPAYNNGWKVKTNTDGTVTDLFTEKSYPYLFWEAETQGLFFDYGEKNMEGWLIRTDTCIAFLENKLTELGLNETEKTDFITFWGPILQKEEFALVQFLVDDAYAENIAEMTIKPAPDAIRRVYLLMAPMEHPYTGIDLVPQEFEPFERNGFTVIEWGGTDLDMSNIKF